MLTSKVSLSTPAVLDYDPRVVEMLLAALHHEELLPK